MSKVSKLPRKGHGAGHGVHDGLGVLARAKRSPAKATGSATSIMTSNVTLPVPTDTADQKHSAIQSSNVSSGGGGQCIGDLQTPCATAPNQSAGQVVDDDQIALAGEGEIGDRIKTAIDLIMLLHREYRGLQQTRGDIERRIRSTERWCAVRRTGSVPTGKDFKFPTVIEQDEAQTKRLYPRWFAAREAMTALEKDCLKQLLGFTEFLPVMPWVKNTKGLGIPSFAAIVAHAGDLSNYDGPAKLWKRFSLHVIDGKASRRVRGDYTQSFVPVRRAEMHVIGDTLLRSNGPYADLYRERKAYEVQKANDAGLTVRPAARIPKKDADKFISEGLIHKRSLRYIEKRLLRDLWRAWRDANWQFTSDDDMHPAPIREAA